MNNAKLGKIDGDKLAMGQFGNGQRNLRDQRRCKSKGVSSDQVCESDAQWPRGALPRVGAGAPRPFDGARWLYNRITTSKHYVFSARAHPLRVVVAQRPRGRAASITEFDSIGRSAPPARAAPRPLAEADYKTERRCCDATRENGTQRI
ncbi:hypothetical protein EVAR_53949_1 [Eumeta japonica]|uniref:Uncharacterized protein n=1 Tax=Eumeta variegata TaxID=151549 RepID=A0A4C1ZEX2_EUMVA|nr:hypothetical protein EVAR_53949_1 [Eumeta japonica]